MTTDKATSAVEPTHPMTAAGPSLRQYLRDLGEEHLVTLLDEALEDERAAYLTSDAFTEAFPLAAQGHCASDCCDYYPRLHVHGSPEDYAAAMRGEQA